MLESAPILWATQSLPHLERQELRLVLAHVLRSHVAQLLEVRLPLCISFVCIQAQLILHCLVHAVAIRLQAVPSRALLACLHASWSSLLQLQAFA